MINDFLKIVSTNRNHFFGFLNHIHTKEKKIFVLGDILEAFNEYTNKDEITNEDLKELTVYMQEAVCIGNCVYLDIRVKIGKSEFYVANLEETDIELITIQNYLIIKEKFASSANSDNILNLNFEPFYDKMPSVRDAKSIGKGVEYLNKFLSSNMFTDNEKWQGLLLNFMKLHKHNGSQLILNDRIRNSDELNKNIDKAIKMLRNFDGKEAYKSVKHKLQDLGFEPGLGKDVKEIIKSLEILDNLLDSPDHITLAEFLSRIPMIFNVAVISPHGYFGQENVLGLPDTGGQVVYILDQVKALEKSLTNSLKQAGLNVLPKIIILTRLIPNAGNTKCNTRLEKVMNTKNTWILRVPFRNHNKNVTDNWISRFEIWPYLEEFAADSYIELKAEFNGKPDLIIGNYSDGNLVSYLLSKRFDVTNCCIAHALEKSKYLFSDLYWKELDDHYNFSLQFTADLIAMNSSDFQITSTYQEIAGTNFSVGQYETHKHFTLPDLYRVENGVNLYHTKFNIISPGVNEKIYFPYTNIDKRIEKTRDNLNSLIFENIKDDDVYGELNNPNLLPLFSMARLDKNKNLTALVRWFGQNKELQEKANVILVAGQVDASKSSDKEEIDEINYMHELIDEYNLYNKIRWIGKLFRKDEAGEVYRIIADRKGFFVQPGLFEGFGLTVLEAMISGLPVIATKYGGPLEIIKDGESGFHIDPVNDEESSSRLYNIVSQSIDENDFWDRISKNSVKRVNEAYNWKLYSQKILSNAKIYGFWKYVKGLETKDMEAYLDIIYHLLYKQRAAKLLDKHNSM
jgi:sucrose synthase